VRSAVLLFLWMSVAFPLVTGMHIEPVKAAWSGWAPSEFPNNFVSQSITVNFDELDSASGAYCELFVGAKGSGGQYNLSVLTTPGGFRIGSGVGNGNADHQWVRFKIGIDVPDSIVKGKVLTFKFTRSGGDSIQFYYDSTDMAEQLDSGPGRPRMA